jgi:hypothetical protein
VRADAGAQFFRFADQLLPGHVLQVFVHVPPRAIAECGMSNAAEAMG